MYTFHLHIYISNSGKNWWKMINTHQGPHKILLEPMCYTLLCNLQWTYRYWTQGNTRNCTHRAVSNNEAYSTIKTKFRPYNSVSTARTLTAKEVEDFSDEQHKQNDRQRLKKIRDPSVQGGGIALRFAAFLGEGGQGNFVWTRIHN